MSKNNDSSKKVSFNVNKNTIHTYDREPLDQESDYEKPINFQKQKKGIFAKFTSNLIGAFKGALKLFNKLSSFIMPKAIQSPDKEPDPSKAAKAEGKARSSPEWWGVAQDKQREASGINTKGKNSISEPPAQQMQLAPQGVDRPEGKKLDPQWGNNFRATHNMSNKEVISPSKVQELAPPKVDNPKSERPTPQWDEHFQNIYTKEQESNPSQAASPEGKKHVAKWGKGLQAKQGKLREEAENAVKGKALNPLNLQKAPSRTFVVKVKQQNGSEGKNKSSLNYRN